MVIKLTYELVREEVKKAIRESKFKNAEPNTFKKTITYNNGSVLVIEVLEGGAMLTFNPEVTE